MVASCLIFLLIIFHSGTSNWSGDYFVNTGGVSCIVNQTADAANQINVTIQGQLLAIFNRDWYSNYTISVLDYNP